MMQFGQNCKAYFFLATIDRTEARTNSAISTLGGVSSPHRIRAAQIIFKSSDCAPRYESRGIFPSDTHLSSLDLLIPTLAQKAVKSPCLRILRTSSSENSVYGWPSFDRTVHRVSPRTSPIWIWARYPGSLNPVAHAAIFCGLWFGSAFASPSMPPIFSVRSSSHAENLVILPRESS